MAEKKRDSDLDPLMSSVDESRRSVLKKLLGAGAILGAAILDSVVLTKEAHAQGRFGKWGKKWWKK